MEYGDREGKDFSGGQVFFLVCCKLLSQAKVDGAHVVEYWFRGPHGREDLPHGADVLFQALFVDGLVVDHKDARADLVREYL